MDVHDFVGRLYRFAILTVSIILILTTPQRLQAGVTGKISGKLKDPVTGVVVVGATIQVIGTNFGSISDDLGRFVILNIPPGQYTLRISIIGFETLLLNDVPVTADLTTRFDLTMQPSVLQGQEVVVHAAKDVIDKDLAGTRVVVTQDQFNSLPITQMSEALTLQSGVSGEGDYLKCSRRKIKSSSLSHRWGLCPRSPTGIFCK